MSIRTTTFGGVTLSGKEAKDFRQKIDQEKSNTAAKNTIKNGKKIIEDIDANGFATITLPKKD